MLLSLDIQKEYSGEFWTNRYILDVTSFAAAESPAEQIVAAERAIHLDVVNFVSYRVSDTIPGNDQYFVVPLTGGGARTTATQALPLFDVARVDFFVTLGRPSRKYLRGVLVEGDQENFGQLLASTVLFINENYTDPVAALVEYVDVDGQSISGGNCYPRVGMRQLRRGSRRRTEPVIPVS